MTFRFVRGSYLLLLACGICLAQKAQNQGSGATGLSGETYRLSDWPSTPPDDKDARIVAYHVVGDITPPQTMPLSQPLILVKNCSSPEQQSPSNASHCVPGQRNPLRDRQKLLIEIDDLNGLLTFNGITLLNLNVVSQAGSTITPDQVRSSLPSSGGGGGGAGGGGASGFASPRVPMPRSYYLTWPTRLSGDTVLTVTVSAVMQIITETITRTAPAPPGTPVVPATGLLPDFVTQTVDNTSEQVLTLLNVQYPQVHALDSFNIATGVIYSSLRNPSWTRVESAAAVPCPPGTSNTCSTVPEMYQSVETPGSRAVDPALFFTAYVFGKFDAERKEHWSDLKPEPSIGLSLSSPATDFFFGASSEVWRGVQIVGGVHEGKINALAPTLVNDPTSSTAPSTVQHFHTGYFIGVTFNINFIQGLFGGGKGGGS